MNWDQALDADDSGDKPVPVSSFAPPSTVQGSALEKHANEAMRLIAAGNTEKGAEVLVRHLSGALQRTCMHRYRISIDDAEELVMEAIFKIVKGQFQHETQPLIWIRTIVRNVCLDWLEKARAAKRGGPKTPTDRGDAAGAQTAQQLAERQGGQGSADFEQDGDAFLAERVSDQRMPAWIRLCVERAAWQFERDEPRRAEVLRMKTEGWSAEEIALHFGATPPVQKKQEVAARNRVLDAMKRAREYFQHCKDDE